MKNQPTSRNEIAEEAATGTSRRDFLRIVGAGLAVSSIALSGCRLPEERILPFTQRPDGFVPDLAKRYTTLSCLNGYATGLLATSYEGRPVKIEGNPLHPASLGAATAQQQASILDLYCIDRLKVPINLHESRFTELENVLGSLRESLSSTGGNGFALLTGNSTSLSERLLLERLTAAYPGLRIFSYDALSWDNLITGAEQVFGKRVRPVYDLSRVSTLLTIEDDLLGIHPDSVRLAHDYAERRTAESGMLRHYATDNQLSITSSNADHILRIRSSETRSFLLWLAGEICRTLGSAAVTELESILNQHKAPVSANNEVLRNLVADLTDQSSQSLITLGAHHPPELHAIAYYCNRLLGSDRSVIGWQKSPHPPGYAGGVIEFINAVSANDIKRLLIIGGDIARTAGGFADLRAQLSAIRETVHFTDRINLTTEYCRTAVPLSHDLECWQDGFSWDGTYSLAQPLIRPLFSSISRLELLGSLAGEHFANGQELLKATYRRSVSDRESRWQSDLQQGFVTGFSDAETVLTISHSSLAALAGSTQDYVNGSGTELRIVPDNKILDGSYAGNGWLQEMPDPITKLTWDNALCISPNDAKAQGVDTGEIVELAAGSNSVRVAVLVSPLQADGSMSLAMGYGQHGNLTSAQYKKLASIDPNYSGIPARDLAQGIGVNACVLQNAPAEFIVANVSIKRTGKKHQLALTQDPYFIDKLGKREREKRAFVQIRSTTLDFFKHNPDFVSYYDHHVKLKSLWTEHDYSEHKWALAIDLNRCIGCGSCLVACQSENNVPVVGRRRILEGREMHWLRLDRYTVEHNGVAFSLAQPLGCQHCELAPCEQVCPVAATTHSSEGLNDMVYNRCIGTRYCANNCPFKVRRFNYFDYRKGITPTEEMQFNPDVTVRSRGVMEKCSFCVQRIQEAKIASKNSDEPIPDGAIQPACAQTCPTKAIAFGDLNDKSSKSAKWNADKRAYVLLRELNIKPRVSYLAKIRNPAPGTPEADYPKPETHGHGTGKKHSSEKEHH